MNATLEKLLGTIESVPPSPSAFLDHRPAPVDGLQPQDDLALDYISRMLMEDGDDNKFFREYPDHPSILKAEQPFAEILSASQKSMSTDMLASTMLSGHENDTENNMHVQNPAFLEPNNRLHASEGSNSEYMLSSMAFCKGMADTHNFLPRENGQARYRENKSRIDRNDDTGADVGRSNKQLAVLVQPDAEEDALCEIFDNLVLNGYDMCPNDQLQEIHVAVEREKKMQQRRVYNRKTLHGSCHTSQPLVVDLETQLIRCADAVANTDWHNASKLLEKVKLHSSPMGDATQRQAYYFAKGLEARLAGEGSQLYRTLTTDRCTCPAEILKALQVYMATCCFTKVAFQFANKTIYDAALGKNKLHIVYYGNDLGFQWTELFQLLAGRVGGPPEVRITSIRNQRLCSCLAQPLEDIGRRLKLCASQFGMPLKFHAIVVKPEVIRAEDLDIDPDEVLVVSNIFHFENLMDESLAVDNLSPRDLVLNNIRRMKPTVFVHAVVNGSYSAASFVTRFREALYHFAALFDAIEATMPRGNDKRLLIERNILAWSAMNIIACEGVDRVQRPQNYKEWQARNKRAGLRQLPLDANLVQRLKDTVKKQFHKNFMINEDNWWLLQGWKGRVLYALSTWTIDNCSSSESE